MKIAIDFDGTCVSHEFPKVGNDIGAIPVLKELVKNGHKLILYTMRSNGQELGDVLDDAINWFKENDIELYSIQKDIDQEKWTSSNKCYSELYIDDAALGCPLKFNESISSRNYVDWDKVKEFLFLKGLIYTEHIKNINDNIKELISIRPLTSNNYKN